MAPITILQSAADAGPDLVSRCMTSVADGSQLQGYSYHCVGDELFDQVKSDVGTKLRDRRPIRADLAKLALDRIGIVNAWRTGGVDRC